ncbi:hypothetical protein NF701_12340 [Sphingomonadaceae bacterium OTU29THOMA1]|nr:hypothetical protein NF701_12340 [Sphingomonadaceae bacterium OTU29THOMA1]
MRKPSNIVVHSLTDVRNQLKRGRPFFVDIVRDGFALSEAEDHPFEQPQRLSVEAARAEAQASYDQWFVSANRYFANACDNISKKWDKEAAFLLHQAAERFYHCTLLVLTLYSPKSHKLNFLRSQAERIAPSLIVAWPRTTRFEQRGFELLGRPMSMHATRRTTK